MKQKTDISYRYRSMNGQYIGIGHKKPYQSISTIFPPLCNSITGQAIVL